MDAKVIYNDGSIGVEDVSRLEDLTEEGKIAAYKIYQCWVEVRRKLLYDPNYQGPDRRKSQFTICN